MPTISRDLDDLKTQLLGKRLVGLWVDGHISLKHHRQYTGPAHRLQSRFKIRAAPPKVVLRGGRVLAGAIGNGWRVIKARHTGQPFVELL